MSYGRDPDAASRGFGAIASVDHAVPAARWRRQRVGNALKRRDRVMSAVSRGALSGSWLDVATPTKSATFTGPDGGKTIINDHRSHPQPITAPATPYKPRIDPLRVPVRDENGALTYGKPVVTTGTRTTPTLPPGAVAPPAGIAPLPQIVQPTAGSGTVGAGGSLPTTPAPVATTSVYDPLPQVPGADLTASASDDGTMKMVMIAGGAALLAFLIFRNRGTP